MRQYHWNEKGISLGLFIISVAIAGVGVAFVSIAHQMSSAAHHAAAWKKIPAEVTEARLITEKGETRPFIEYVYENSGTRYTGSRLFLSEGPYDKLEPLEDGIRVTYKNEYEKPVTEEYRKGADIEIYNNPHIPQESVVNPIVIKQLRGFMFLGICAVLVAMFLGARSFMYE